MNKEEAQQLAKRIRREASHLDVSLEFITSVGWEGWAVNLYTKSSHLLLSRIEALEEWNKEKQYFLH